MNEMGYIGPIFQWVVFAVSAVLCAFGSIMMVTRRNPIHGALWLIVAFFSLAVIYLTLSAQFIAVAQVIVYAGAIMMLIVFVIMLIQLDKETVRKARISGPKVIGAFITVILFLEIGAAILSFGNKIAGPVVAGASGSPANMGTVLYGKYLFPFEIASVLLLIGIVGAVVLARRRGEAQAEGR